MDVKKIVLDVLSESKKKNKKDDRCVRLAKQKYDTWPSAYASGAVVKCRQGKIWKEEVESLDEATKTDYSKEKESGLHGWFSRQGGKGKSQGWVDCNTCRTDSNGKKTCKSCGRSEGEDRSKYPACRPTPSACGTKGKGENWGKKTKMSVKENVKVSNDLQHHLENEITLSENVFRIYSEKYFRLINEVRSLYNRDLIRLNEEDSWIVESDLGKKVLLESGDEVYLDAPMYEEELEGSINEALHRGKNVKIGSPFRTPGGPKKFAVYVKTGKGTVKKVTFGDPNLRVKNNNKGAAKSFRARHKCDQKKDRTTAGYWSCNVGRYAKKLGLKSSSSW